MGKGKVKGNGDRGGQGETDKCVSKQVGRKDLVTGGVAGAGEAQPSRSYLNSSVNENSNHQYQVL